MSQLESGDTASTLHKLTWGLLLLVSVLFVLGRESSIAGWIGLLVIGLVWLSLVCGMRGLYLIARSKSGRLRRYSVRLATVIAAILAVLWTLDYAAVLMGFPD